MTRSCVSGLDPAMRQGFSGLIAITQRLCLAAGTSGGGSLVGHLHCVMRVAGAVELATKATV
jgi:hypothetical protein